MNGRQIAIGSLILTGVGVIFAGAQLRSPSGSPSGPAPAAAVGPGNRTATQDNCGNISGNIGNVAVSCSNDVNIRTAVTEKPFDRFEGSANPDGIDKFVKFVESHDNKIVRLKLTAEPNDDSATVRVSSDEYEGKQRLIVTRIDSCDWSNLGPLGPLNCGGTEYVASTNDGGELYWTNGYWVLDGYFSIEPAMGMHQGFLSVGLRGISDSEARLADPQGR